MHTAGNGGGVPPQEGPVGIPPNAPRSNRATTILVIGILGFVCCQLLAPIAWYMGHQELQAIRTGRVSVLDEGTTKAGMILGIIGTILLLLGVFWFVFLGGMAFISAVMQT